MEAVVKVDKLGFLGAHYVSGLVPHLEVVSDLGSRREIVSPAGGGQQGLASDVLPRLHLDAAVGAAATLVGLPEEDAYIVNDAGAFGGHPEHNPVRELALGSSFRHSDAALVGGGRPGRRNRCQGQG